MMFRLCSGCLVKDMQDNLKGIEGLKLVKAWFNGICDRCKENKGVAKGLCYNGNLSNIVSDMSSILVDKDDGISDKRNVEVLEKGFSPIRREIS